jgi:hypothetical protein
MVHEIVKEMFRYDDRPVKQHSQRIAELIVKMYPESLKDTIDGRVIGTGSESLFKQIYYRVENEDRKPKRKKQESTSGMSSAAKQSARRKLSVDSCGCTNFSPELDDEEIPMMKAIEEQLVGAFRHKTRCDVNDLMTKSFPLMRQEILQGATASTLLDEWPFLFDLERLVTTFHNLTSVDFRGQKSLHCRDVMNREIECIVQATRGSVALTRGAL